MTRTAVKCVVLFISIWLSLALEPSLALARQLEAPPRPQAGARTSLEPFNNIRVDDVVQPVVAALLARSETFRRQWAIITAAPLIRVTIVLRFGVQDTAFGRARTEVSRYAHGAIRATIELPGATDLTELLAHEFEHIIEQLEGTDLPTLARHHDNGVVEVQEGVFETARAKAAGRRVYREVYGTTDPAVAAALARIRRAWRALGSGSGVMTASKSPESRRNPRRVGPTSPGPHLHKRW